ncbi:MAG: SCO family protein [Robiginitomaculum sp.]|nr:MAG: SCO family protein [Robiginitomaculum sp.]
MSRSLFKPFVGLFAATALGLGGCGPQDVAISGPNTVVSGKAAIGGPFSLIDHTGKAVSEADFMGRPQLIYFGFAFCPDICPTALQQMGAALEIAAEKDADLKTYYQTLFITIDAERDTPEQMALYVTANGFPENLVGLTGSEAQIDAVKKAFAVIGNKVPDPSSAIGYTYDHSSLIYLMDKNGEFVDVFTHADTPTKIAQKLIAYKKTGL